MEQRSSHVCACLGERTRQGSNEIPQTVMTHTHTLDRRAKLHPGTADPLRGTNHDVASIMLLHNDDEDLEM